MKAKIFAKLIKELQIDVYDQIRSDLNNKHEGCETEAETSCIVDGIIYHLDIIGRVTKESYSEEGTTDEAISHEVEIKHEIKDFYYYNGMNIQIAGILTEKQEETINNLLN